MTVFSAPNYCGEFDNAGAMMSVDDTLMCSFQVRRPPRPPTAPLRANRGRTLCTWDLRSFLARVCFICIARFSFLPILPIPRPARCPHARARALSDAATCPCAPLRTRSLTALPAPRWQILKPAEKRQKASTAVMGTGLASPPAKKAKV